MRSRNSIDTGIKFNFNLIPLQDRLTLEVLLDIRDLLQQSEDRMVKMEAELSKAKDQMVGQNFGDYLNRQ
jgi:hypothetical protein